MDKLKTTGFPLLSRHMPRHQPVHYDGFPVDNHTLQQQYEADDWVNQGKIDVIRTAYRKTRSQDNPSDRHGILLSSILHQKAYYGLQGADPLSMVQSLPIPWERQVLPQYLHGIVNAPDYTNSYNSSALDG